MFFIFKKFRAVSYEWRCDIWTQAVEENARLWNCLLHQQSRGAIALTSPDYRVEHWTFSPMPQHIIWAFWIQNMVVQLIFREAMIAQKSMLTRPSVIPLIANCLFFWRSSAAARETVGRWRLREFGISLHYWLPFDFEILPKWIGSRSIDWCSFDATPWSVTCHMEKVTLEMTET